MPSLSIVVCYTCIQVVYLVATAPTNVQANNQTHQHANKKTGSSVWVSTRQNATSEPCSHSSVVPVDLIGISLGRGRSTGGRAEQCSSTLNRHTTIRIESYPSRLFPLVPRLRQLVGRCKNDSATGLSRLADFARSLGKRLTTAPLGTHMSFVKLAGITLLPLYGHWSSV